MNTTGMERLLVKLLGEQRETNRLLRKMVGEPVPPEKQAAFAEVSSVTKGAGRYRRA